MATSAQLPEPAAPMPAAGPLAVRADVTGSAARVSAVGEVDLSSVRQLRHVVLEVVAGGATEVDLDLSAVTFIDCTGISVLLACVDEAARAGADVSISALSTRVTRLLELTGTTPRLVPRPRA